MSDERVLVINKGAEFKSIIVDKIDKKNIFYDQYVDAARMLDDIVARRDKEMKKWCQTEYENNIIAFCGERGEGKSSAMISFVKAIHEYSKNGENSIFSGFENIQDVYFAEPIIIDPSMFDGIHNVLDIIFATLYKKFRNQYEGDNQSPNTSKREMLLDQFQKAYKCISLINNQAKMLDGEYDYEGHISKLSKLGQSTELRSELEKLIKMYLEVMLKTKDTDKERKAGSLLIAIDDLDLCSFHVYKMAEQIRKYLIIPQVVIVMAVKVEQLELCIQEKNLRNYRRMVHASGEESGILEEVINMSERYVAKLIPKVRRNYLPNVRMLNYVKILYEGRELNFKEKSLNDKILGLIYQKTGMKFLKERPEKNYFLPNNLRDTINLIVLLADMEKPDGEDKNSVYYNNIQKFSGYYERQWLPDNFTLKESREIQKLSHIHSQSNRETIFRLYECYSSTKKKNETSSSPMFVCAESQDSFSLVINWMKLYQMNVFGEDEKKYAYAFHILYTIRLNELLRLEQYDKIISFIGGYIWAWNFQNVLPLVQGSAVDRSRFTLSTVCTFNTIAGELYPDRDILVPESAKAQYYITEIAKDDVNRNYKIMSWILMGIFSNTFWTNPSQQLVYAFDTVSVIYMNHSIIQMLHISLENYIISLCSLERIYDKVNMDCLGVDKYEFGSIIKSIQELNKEVIEAFRMMVTNIDIALAFTDYCFKRRNIKDGGYKDDLQRTQAAVNIFFRNVSSFMSEHFGIHDVKFDCLELETDGVRKKISISHLYALLVQGSVKESAELLKDNWPLNGKKEEMVKEFASKLREKSAFELPLEKVVLYMVTKTAENAKKNLDNLASNIQRYYSMHLDERLQEPEIQDLCEFYGKIIDAYIINPLLNIPDELSEKYKQVAKRYQKVCH